MVVVNHINETKTYETIGATNVLTVIEAGHKLAVQKEKKIFQTKY